VVPLGADARHVAADEVGQPSARSLLTSNTPGSSGGINVASLSRSVGGGGGGGGGGVGGRGADGAEQADWWRGCRPRSQLYHPDHPAPTDQRHAAGQVLPALTRKYRSC